MRQNVDAYLFAGAFAPVLSLDALTSHLDPETGFSTFDIEDDSLNPTHLELERAEAIAAVTRFVDDLPQRDREIVRRLFWEDETQTEIAESYGISKMAISKALARIVRRGQISLAPHENLPFMN